MANVDGGVPDLLVTWYGDNLLLVVKYHVGCGNQLT